MLRIYKLGLSIVLFILADRDLARAYGGILSKTLEIVKTSAGSINPYTAGGEFYADDCISGLIAFVGTACIFALCPVTPVGALVAGTSMLLGGFALEVSIKLIKNKEIKYFEIFARHMSKSMGSGVYVLLSAIPNAPGIIFAFAVLYTASIYYSKYRNLVPECMTITGTIFTDLLSFRWISGNCTFGFPTVMSIMLFMIFIVNFSSGFVRYGNLASGKRSLIALILLIPSLFAPKNLFFLLIVTIWFQRLSWHSAYIYRLPQRINRV